MCWIARKKHKKISAVFAMKGCIGPSVAVKVGTISYGCYVPSWNGGLWLIVSAIKGYLGPSVVVLVGNRGRGGGWRAMVCRCYQGWDQGLWLVLFVIEASLGSQVFWSQFGSEVMISTFFYHGFNGTKCFVFTCLFCLWCSKENFICLLLL